MKLRNALIALVTDGAAWATDVAGSLRAEGADVRTCAPGRDLWSVLAAERFTAVAIADVGTGDEAGWILRALQEEPRTRALPAVVLRPDETTGASHELVPGIRALISESRKRAAAEEKAGVEIKAVMHDVQALLGIAMGFAANLRDGVAGPVSEAQRDHARKIVEATTDASAYLNALLESQRHCTSSLPPPRENQRAQVDLGALVNGVARLFEGQAADRGVTLVRREMASVHVWADPLPLKQVVTNLLANALKFTPRGGRVTVSVRSGEPLERQGAGARRTAELVVSDTGPGIPLPQRDRVFELGARLDRDAPIAGHGIGLSVVRDVVMRHGGVVGIGDSSEGGAELTVRLPLDLRSRREGQAPLDQRGDP